MLSLKWRPKLQKNNKFLGLCRCGDTKKQKQVSFQISIHLDKGDKTFVQIQIIDNDLLSTETANVQIRVIFREEVLLSPNGGRHSLESNSLNIQ